jgi:glucose/arabinose dehydrogenase
VAVTLTAGTYPLRLDILSNQGYNINYIDLIPVGSTGGDTTAPTATLAASPVTTAGGTNYTFTVTYADNQSIDTSTLDSNDVRVTGPGGTTLPVTFVSSILNGTSRVATYRIAAPGGSWDAADNGTYTVAMQSAQVRDSSGNAVAAGTLGSFQVNVGSTTPPAGSPIRIQAEDYVSAVDSDPANVGGKYRNDYGVDIWDSLDVGGGYTVGATAQGESLTYNLTVPTTGTYNLVARVASASPGPHSLGVSVNGQTLTTLNFAGTGDWFNWTDTAPVAVTLTAGTYPLRLDILSNQGYNINYIDLIPVTTSAIALKSNSTIFVNEASGAAKVTVVRTGNTQERVTTEYTLNKVDGQTPATPGSDYVEPTLNGRPNTGLLVFEPGEVEKDITIPIINDTLIESNENFALGLTSASPESTGLLAPRTVLITIVDDDSPSAISFRDPAVTVSEGAGTASITVQRSGNTSGSATVNFSTSNGAATAGSDYTARSGTITFAPDQITQTITIPIINDTIPESNENFTITLSSPTGSILGSQTTSTVTILDNDSTLGTLNRQTYVSGLNTPTAFDWTPDGRYMLVAQKGGIVKVVDNSTGTLRSTPLIDLSSQVNSLTIDRGILGIAVHPNFPNMPYVYIAYTYDPPETAGRSGLAGPDGSGNRPSRVIRLAVDPNTMVASLASLQVIVGKNGTWNYISRPDLDSTGDTGIPPSGIVNGSTITAPASEINVGTQDNAPDLPGLQNQNIRDYLASDSETHTIGAIHFGPDGYLYVANGDGTSYNFVDPRAVRVQDKNNLSGKLLRIDPMTGLGVPGNPFYDPSDPNSNQSKVFYYGFRNPFRFTFDPMTKLPVVGDVGWNAWEEINTGPTGSNFGWPYLEGPGVSAYNTSSSVLPLLNPFIQNGYRNSPSDQPAVFPLVSLSHGGPDNFSAVVIGDFYNNDTLIYGDLYSGRVFATTLNSGRQVTETKVLDGSSPYIVDFEMGPDGRLYGVDLLSGLIVRWNPA